jgi:hypothetical protein
MNPKNTKIKLEEKMIKLNKLFINLVLNSHMRTNTCWTFKISSTNLTFN